MKNNVLLTASDRRYGDFLIEHWFRSLRENSDLGNIDVAVMDYGLSLAQHYYLEKHGIITRKGKRDGHVAVIRYREMRDFLTETAYNQVALCDSGDIIFQGDISPVFQQDTSSYRAVCEDYKPFFSVFISSDFFDPADRQRLSECFIHNRMVNGGFIVAPRDRMIHLADECLSTIRDMTRFGPDQIVLNGVLYEEGFVELEKTYNYVIATAKEGVSVESGVVKTANGRMPLVVHNAGNLGLLRPIEDFGYGPERNKLKEDTLNALKTLYQSTEGFFKTQELFIESRRRFRTRLRKMIRNLRLID